MVRNKFFSSTENQRIIFLEHREENESQSDYSTTITEPTAVSNPNENGLLTDHQPIKKHRKQQHVSIGPTTVATRSSSLPITIIETHFNRDELPPIPTHRMNSPILSTTSSDTEIEGNIANRTRSTTPTPSPTLNQTRLQSVSEYDTLQTISSNDIFKRHSIIYDDRPPARLEKRNSSLSNSPERSNQNEEENNLFSFFE
jgi:hypothetical protein